MQRVGAGGGGRIRCLCGARGVKEDCALVERHDAAVEECGSASALRVARWRAEPESCCAGSQTSCMRKEAERREARYGMERAEEGGGPRVRSQSWEAVESEAKRAAPDQPRRVNMAAILAINSASVKWPARAWRPSQPR